MQNVPQCIEKRIGYVVSGGGDINGDGISDIVIGDPGVSQYFTNFSTVLYGTKNPIAPVFYVNNINGTNGFAINGIGGSALVMNNKSDITGKGKAALIANNNNGSISVIFGTGAGFNISGFDASSQPVFSLAIGDVNGDGKSDIIIGAQSTPPIETKLAGTSAAGAVYVIFGQDNLSQANVANVANLNGLNGFKISFNTSKYMVDDVATGHINQDQYLDLLLATMDPSTCLNEVFVILGRAHFAADNPLNSATLDANSGYRVLYSPTSNQTFTQHNVSCNAFSIDTADVDGNGRDELLIGTGASTTDPSAYVVFFD
jgi:glycosylphosphatidylinositol phospholipase D